MDPDVAYRTAIDINACVQERRDAARSLLTWLYGGGFMPSTLSTDDATRHALIRELQSIRDLHLPRTPPPRHTAHSLDNH